MNIELYIISFQILAIFSLVILLIYITYKFVHNSKTSCKEKEDKIKTLKSFTHYIENYNELLEIVRVFMNNVNDNKQNLDYEYRKFSEKLMEHIVKNIKNNEE